MKKNKKNNTETRTVKAVNKNVRSSTRKLSPILKSIVGKKADEAIRDLTFSVAPTTAEIGLDVFLDSVTSGSISLTAPSTSGTSIIKIGKVLAADGSTLTQPCKIDVEFVVGIS